MGSEQAETRTATETERMLTEMLFELIVERRRLLIREANFLRRLMTAGPPAVDGDGRGRRRAGGGERDLR